MDCIFCKISKRKTHSYIIDEDAEFMAFMDIFPPTFNRKVTSPAVIVIPKKHYKSNAFEDLPDTIYKKIMVYTKKIAKKIQKNLKPLRVCMVIEGMEIKHFHIKLYLIFKEHYPGYLSTEKGANNKATRADTIFLENITKIIRGELKNGKAI